MWREIGDLDPSIGGNHPQLRFDFSDEISAQYIIEKVGTEQPVGSAWQVDYLQLLDQNRSRQICKNK